MVSSPGVRAESGGVIRTVPGGDVVPFCVQLSAQHNLASATSGVTCFNCAFLQQSISDMSAMPQSLSFKYTGTPAKALLKRMSNRNSEPMRFFISV